MTLLEEKWEIYTELNLERTRVIDPDTGHVMRREAWDRIDELLDRLNEINAFGLEVVNVPGN